MADSVALDDFESRLRALLASVDRYQMRPANGTLFVSFKDIDDFLAAVRSASGVNIAIEAGWLFEPGQPAAFAIDRCYLRFQLSNQCNDERLSFFLEDLALGRQRP